MIPGAVRLRARRDRSTRRSSCWARTRTRRSWPAATRCCRSMRLRLARPATAGGHRPVARPVRTSARTATAWRSARSPGTTTSRTASRSQAALSDRRRTRRRRSATRRCGTWARSAARSRTATRRPTCPPCWSRSTPTSCPQGPAATRGRSTAGEFFTGPVRDGDLAPNEVLTEIRVPKASGGLELPQVPPARPGLGHGRRRGRAIERRRARGLTNMGETPMRAAGVEEALAGGADPARPRPRAPTRARRLPAMRSAAPSTGASSSKVLVRRALEEAMG